MRNLTLTQKLVFIFITSFVFLFLGLYTKPYWENIFTGNVKFNPLSANEILNLIEKEDDEKRVFLKERGINENEEGLTYFSNDLIGISSGIFDFVGVNSDSTYALLFGKVPYKNAIVKQISISYSDKNLHNTYINQLKKTGFVFKQNPKSNYWEASTAQMNNKSGNYFLYTLKFGKYYILTILKKELDTILEISSVNENSKIENDLAHSQSIDENDEYETINFYSEKGELVVLKVFDNKLLVEFPSLDFSQSIKIDMPASELEGIGVYSGKVKFNGEDCKLIVQFLEDDRCSISSSCFNLDKGLCSKQKPNREFENPFVNKGSKTNNGYGNDESLGKGDKVNSKRIRINELNTDLINTDVDCMIYLKITINESGDVISASYIPSKSTTNDIRIINQVISLVKKEVRYSKSVGSGIEVVFMNVRLKAK